MAFEAIKGICSYADKVRFSSMLRGLAEDSDVERNMNELYNYVNDEKKAFYVSDCFRRALLAKSPVVCCIMGLILSDVKNKNIMFSQKDIILMSGISDLSDFDLLYFDEITEEKYIKTLVDNRQKENICIVTDAFPHDKETDYGLTIDMCCQNRILHKKTIITSEGYAHLEEIIYDEIGKALKNYIYRARVQLGYK